MPGAPFAAVAAVHAVILCALAVFAVRVPRRSRTGIALAALLYNAVPLSPVIGMAAPVFLHDLCAPLVLALVFWRGSVSDKPLLALCATAALLWPAIGTLVGLLANPDFGVGENAQFLYRRFAFVVFFAAGLSGVLKRDELSDFMNAGLVIWVGMAIAGLLQYAGVLDTDLWESIDPDLRGGTIVETAAAARGFMGLNRGAVGVWGSAAAAYAFAMLSVLPLPRYLPLIAYGAVGALSTAVILLAGSRTGLIAAVAGVSYIVVRLAGTGRPGAMLRVIGSLAAIAVAAAVGANHFDIEGLSSRFSFKTGGAETGQQRADVQSATVAFVLGDSRALVIGMGHSESEFRRRVGERFDLSHSHSEYIEVLWEAGVIGLVLYAAFVILLFRQLRPPRDAPPGALFAARAILVAGAVAGLAVGNIFITSARLAPFSLLMAFAYGALVNEAVACRRERWSADCATYPPVRQAQWSSS